jgi:O-antigen/teichoic acid export membrane protein
MANIGKKYIPAYLRYRARENLFLSQKYGAFHNIYGGAGILICGHGVRVAFGILAYALIARGLGAEQFGIFALIQAYVNIMDRMLNFQSRQAMVGYGARWFETRHAKEFTHLFLFLLRIDSIVAITAACCAVLIVSVTGTYLHWPPLVYWATLLYCLILPVNVTGAPVGALRLFNRFALISIITGCGATAKLAGILGVYLVQGEISSYVAVWVVVEVCERLSTVGLGWRELKRQNMFAVIDDATHLSASTHPGVWKFLWSSNLESMVRLLFQELDVFIVAWLLNLPSVAAYKLIKEVATVVNGTADTIHQSSYPAFAALKTNGKFAKMRQYLTTMRTVGLILSGAIISVYYIIGAVFINLVFGAQYAYLFYPLLVALIGPLIWLSFSGYASAVYALGLVPKLIVISFLASMTSVLCHAILTARFGIVGAAWSYTSYFIVWLLCSSWVVERELGAKI